MNAGLEADCSYIGEQFAQKPQPLRAQLARDARYSRNIAAGPVQACHNPIGNRIITGRKHDGDFCGGTCGVYNLCSAYG